MKINEKLTENLRNDILYSLLPNGTNINDIKTTGLYGIMNATGTLPKEYSTDDNNIFIQNIMWSSDYGRQFMYDVRTTKVYTRILSNNSWQKWILESDNYSADEIIIGTYFDKPLYRKVLNLGTLTGTTETSHQTGLTNIKYLTKFEGACTCENAYGMKLPTNGDQINSVIFRARLENNFSILKTERSNNSFQNVLFTIEYTKATD